MSDIYEPPSRPITDDTQGLTEQATETYEPPAAAAPQVQLSQNIGRLEQTISMYDDPEEARAKANASFWLAERMDLEPGYVFQNFDSVYESYWGEVQPPKSAWRAIQDEWKIGAVQVQMGRAGFSALMSDPDTWERSLAEIEQLQQYMPDQDAERRSLPVRVAKGAAGLLPMMLSSASAGWQRGLEGAAAGALAAGIAGQLGPQIAAPEEIVTVPGAAIAGFRIAQRAGSLTEAARLEAGHAFLEIANLQDAEGNRVNPTIARAAALGVGAINGAIELAQIEELVSGIPGAERVVQGAIRKVTRNALVSGVLKSAATEAIATYGTRVATETVQELAQESVSIVMAELATALNNEVAGTSIEQSDVDEILSRLGDVAEQSITGFAGLAIPGSVISVYQSRTADSRAQNVNQEAPVTEAVPETAREQVQPPPELADIETQYNEALRRVQTDPAAINDVVRLGDQLDSLANGMAQEIDTAPQERQAWQMTREEFTAKQAATAPDPVMERTVQSPEIRARIAEAMPQLSDQEIDGAAVLLDIRAEAAGLSTDQYFSETFAGLVGPAAAELPAGKNASVQWAEDGRAIVQFAKTADFSTWTHEMAHVFRRQLPTAEAQIAEQWAGVTDGNWTVEAEEQFAVAFEEYVREGNAPTPELANVFERFADWLKRVYNTLKQRVTVSPEIRQVYDRLLTDSALQQRATQEATPQDVTGGVAVEDELFQTDVHYDAVQQAIQRGDYVPDTVLSEYATEDWAQAELERRSVLREEAKSFESIDDYLSFSMAMSVEDETTAFYLSEIYRTATQPDATGMSVLQIANERWLNSLTKESLTNLLGTMAIEGYESGHGVIDNVAKAAAKGKVMSDAAFKKVMAQLRDDPTQWRRYFAEGTEEAQTLEREIAMSPEETEMEKVRQANRELRRRMQDQNATIDHLRRQKDVLTGTEQTLKQVIERLGINPNRIRRMSDVRNPLEELRKAVDQVREISGDKTLDFSPTAKNIYSQLRTAAELSSKDARELASFASNVRKIAQRELKARQQSKVYYQRLIKQIMRPPSGNILHTRAQEIRDIQAQFKVGERRWEKDARRNLGEYLRDADEATTRRVTERLNRRNLREVTPDELETIAQQVEGLRFTGRNEKALIDLDERILIEEAKEAVKQNVLKGERPTEVTGKGSKETKQLTKTSFLRAIQKGTLRPERIARLLGGGENSAVYDWLWNKINEATDAELRGQDDRLTPGYAKMKEFGVTAKGIAQERTIDGMTYTVDEILSLYIGMQNQNSADAIIYGNKIDPSTVNKFIATLSPGEKAWADWMLDSFGDENYERIAAVVERTENRGLEQVDKYFPMLRQERDATPMEQEIADDLLRRSSYRRMYVQKGFTKSRIEIAPEHQRPIRLGATAVWQESVAKQEKYIASAETVRRLHRIFKDEKVKEAIATSYGDKFNQWIEKYVNDFTNPNIYRTFDDASRVSRMLRANAAASYLAFNVVTMSKQIPSLGLYLADAGPWLLPSAAQFFTNPKATMDFVNERDPQMKNRTMNREMEELALYDKTAYQRVVKRVGQTGMIGIKAFDRAATTIGWKAVYDKNIKVGKSEQEAIRAAQNATLKTQPAGRAKDVAEIYRSAEGFNWFLMFSNQLNQIYNIVTFDVWDYAKHGQVVRGMMSLAGVAISALAIGAIVRRRPQEDAEEVGMDLLAQIVSGIPFVGGNIKSGMDGWFGTGTDPIPAAAQLGRTFREIFDGDNDAEKALEETLQLLTETMVLIGIPTVQPRRVIEAIETGDPWELVGGPPE